MLLSKKYRQSLNILPGQFFKLQALRYSILSPTHICPPLEGAGLSHLLFRYTEPFPQEVEHGVLIQDPHSPSTFRGRE